MDTATIKTTSAAATGTGGTAALLLAAILLLTLVFAVCVNALIPTSVGLRASVVYLTSSRMASVMIGTITTAVIGTEGTVVVLVALLNSRAVSSVSVWSQRRPKH